MLSKTLTMTRNIPEIILTIIIKVTKCSVSNLSETFTTSTNVPEIQAHAAIEHNIDVIVNAVQVLQYLLCHKRLQSNRPTSYHMLVIEQR